MSFNLFIEFTPIYVLKSGKEYQIFVPISNFDLYIPFISNESSGPDESTKSFIKITSFCLRNLPRGTVKGLSRTVILL